MKDQEEKRDELEPELLKGPLICVKFHNWYSKSIINRLLRYYIIII